ncbi:hypothetical protein [Hydrogenophaga crocea]|uniref:Uncharacterized protein n=1 Tax=Hydrogenophaga crocea TaxID=2716225 RepID=A0A6G8IEK9_9BURK|nr:hypothetical protein [Hydrogenophaga crocea]QIM51627.1 hypothetical protein G9Q37_05475 [Hydrogenophaga crocea]
MAQIDPRIAMGFQPTTQLESPMNNLARLLQVQGAQQANQLNQLKMDEYQSGVQRKNKLAALLSGDYATDEDRESALLRGGFMDEANKLKTDRRANAKTDVELDEKRFKVATDRYNAYKQTLGSLAQNPNLSKDLLSQVGQQLVDAGIIPAEMHQRALATMPDDPNVLRQRLREGVAAQMAPDKMLEFFAPKVDKIDNGQQIMYRDTNPNSPTFGQNVAGAPVQKMQTPDSIASNATAILGQNLKFQTDSEANTVAGQAIVSKKIQDVELKLQDDYRTESKGFAETSTAMKKVLSAIETADKNPGSALSAGTAFMKILDPNSVVRETELGMALNASGWFDRATNIVNTLQSGRVMTETQKKNLRQAAQDLFEEAKASQREIDAAYEQRARAYGADPQRVIVDRGQRSGAAPGTPGLPSADAIQAEIERRAKAAKGGR